MACLDEMRGVTLYVVLTLAVVGQALTPATYFTQADAERYKNIFITSVAAGEDLELLHFSVLGISLLSQAVPEPQKVCDNVKKLVNTNDVSSLFYAASVNAALKAANKPCQATLSNAETTLNAAIKADSSSLVIYHAVAALTSLGHKVDAAKVISALEGALKADDTPLSHAYVFFAASYLSGDLKKLHDLIEDIVAQADEVDEKYLQFEGGLLPTALVVDSAYKLAAAAKLPPTLTEDKVMKLANYLLSRKHCQSVKDAAVLLSALSTLTANKFHVPIAVSLASQVSVSEKSPLVQIRVSNLMGQSLSKVTVTADTARHLGDDAVVLSKKPFTANAKDATLFELELMKVKPERGFYRITVSIAPQQPDVKLLGTTGAEVQVKVTTQVSIENVEIGIADKEQSSTPKTTKLTQPGKTSLEADYHQRITTRFTIKDKSTGRTVTAHQTFMRLTNMKTKQEVIFVAEEDTAGAYRFDLDVGAKAKNFNSLSGKYSMDLLVGDAVIENPISWNLADVQLTFQEDAAPADVDEHRHSKKPEIKHLFREPEKRPPSVVSNVFTALVLLPVVILFALWLKIGVNINNFPMSLSAIGFHAGLAAIFGLYFCYFMSLDMFTTMRYLGLIGIPTFLFGNKLLSGIAARRK